jgi:hypothetical protein
MSLAHQFELREQYTAPAAKALPAPLGAKAVTPATITVEGRTIKCLT